MGPVLPFEFESRMDDTELGFEQTLYRVLDILDAIPGARLDDHMRVESGGMLLHLPEMSVMDIHHAIDVADRGHDSAVVDAPGGCPA